MMVNSTGQSDFIAYLTGNRSGSSGDGRVPPLKELSRELEISVSRLREQVEAAKTLGFINVRPRVGIRRLEYSFRPAVASSLLYGIQEDQDRFNQFLDLRRHVETAYFDQAGRALTAVDHEQLRSLIQQAWKKLRGRPVRIPHQEHRKFHLTIYRRLDNVFVIGLLEAYWDAYESVGLNVYADLSYLEEVWTYHQKVAAALEKGRYQEGRRNLQDHFELLMDRLGS